jgi:spore coat polysaccharide biosynthesis protein SpsF (cytidylyltransferase family)
MKIIAITQARLGSTRFPNKILYTVNNKSLLEHHIRRVLRSNLCLELIVATCDGCQPVVDIAQGVGASISIGSESDVLDRYYQAVKDKEADYIVRVTSDCPIIDSAVIDNVIRYTVENNFDYCSNAYERTFPIGQDVEVFKFSALKKAWSSAKLLSEREHVTPFIWDNSSLAGGSLFISGSYTNDKDLSDYRMTVDYEVDAQVIKILIEECGESASWKEYVSYLAKHPQIAKMNAGIDKDEGYKKSLKEDSFILTDS